MTIPAANLVTLAETIPTNNPNKQSQQTLTTNNHNKQSQQTLTTNNHNKQSQQTITTIPREALVGLEQHRGGIRWGVMCVCILMPVCVYI